MDLKTLIELLSRTFDGVAYYLTFSCGLLTIMVERFIYRRRGYKREAKLTAVIGWTYIVGGTALYVTLTVLKQWV